MLVEASGVCGDAAETNPPPKSRLSEKPSSSNPPQELTLSYMMSSKGKEVVADENTDPRWVERDFLQLDLGAAPKRLSDHLEHDQGPDKKVKVETLNLCLGPPSLSLSLNSLDPVKSVGNGVQRTMSNNTFNTRASSDDFGVSLSQSCSHAFSHNPSCSLTRNSTENYEFSRETDHIWYAGAGEGTNGSVHSRFKPIGDATNNSITFSNCNGYPRLPANGGKEITNGFHRVGSFENSSFFPSELPALPVQPKKELGKSSSDGGRNVGFARPERLLREILSESVSVIAQILQDLPSSALEAAKEYLRKLMSEPDKKDDLSSLQKRLERRSDLSFETLQKSHKTQLEILVAVKTGRVNFVSAKIHLPIKELIEIFLLNRCQNVNCRSVLPIDDCDCKICANKKGFCSACMCPVCLNFDCAENTCSWVGCDVCSHWCHAMCGIEKNLIRPGQSLKGAAGTTEMQFHCLGCGHPSEMFGFVKEVFICCAKDWGVETLKKELYCVRKIFRGSEDRKGKELQMKAEEMLNLLEKTLVTPTDACDVLLQFLKYGASNLPNHSNIPKDVINATPLSAIIPSTSTFNSMGSLGIARDLRISPKPSLKALEVTPELNAAKTEGFESLESMVRFKQEEAALFQRLADEARREVEGYRQIARAKSEKLEEEYAAKLAKLHLQETEKLRCKRLEELKALESSHCDYYKMKLRMEAEMAGLLERMEATKQQWA